MIVAKPVIPNQFWILRQDDRKIGNIEAVPDGFSVRINNRIEKFKTIKTIKQQVKIDFESQSEPKKATSDNDVYGYPTTSTPYNGLFDVRHQVPLWTKEPKSKSWYAAGWYSIRQGRKWVATQCPKLIVLDRYDYRGPYKTQEEATAS